MKRSKTGLGWGLLRCLLLVLGLSVVLGGGAQAKVFASQNQALAEAFPDATRIERDTKILLKRDVAQIEAITKETKSPKVVVLHTAWQDETLLGYAHIDVHNVRTKPEAFMVVLTRKVRSGACGSWPSTSHWTICQPTAGMPSSPASLAEIAYGSEATSTASSARRSRRGPPPTA